MKEEQVETVEHTSNVNLGIYLRRKRVIRGLTQSNVASKLGYGSPQFISNIERGIANVPLKSLRRIIDLYQVPPLEVLNILMNDKKRYWCQQLGIGGPAGSGAMEDVETGPGATPPMMGTTTATTTATTAIPTAGVTAPVEEDGGTINPPPLTSTSTNG